MPIDTQKLGRRLQGMGAWWSGQGPYYEAQQARVRQMEAYEKRQREEEAKQRQMQTKQRVAMQVRGALERVQTDPNVSASMIDELVMGLPGAAQSPQIAAIRQSLTAAQADPENAQRHRQQAQRALQQLDTRFVRDGVIEQPGTGDKPAAVKEYEYYNALPDDQKQAYLQLRAPGAMSQYAEDLRDRARQFDVEDIEAEAPAAADAAAQRAQAVGNVETDIATNRARELASVEDEIERERGEPAARTAAERAEFDLNRMTTNIDEIMELADKPRTLGFVGARFADTEGSNAYALRSKLRTLEAYAGFETLVEMKASGGTLGAISERELSLLIASFSALDPNMQKEQFLEELAKFEEQVNRSWTNVSRAYEETYGVPYSNNAPSNLTVQPNAEDDRYFQ